MNDIPKRIFFDTNVYIIGVADSGSDEWNILLWAGFGGQTSNSVEVIVSEEALGVIPREDVGVYLTASKGEADCFVSANHKLIRSLVSETKEFECLTPEDFAKKYLRN
jgi:predicted nucleic acid-binding protein